MRCLGTSCIVIAVVAAFSCKDQATTIARNPPGAVDLAKYAIDPTGVPEKLILYSVELPEERHITPGKDTKRLEDFHGFPVLGKIDVADRDKRSEIFGAMITSISSPKTIMAACFWPHHGLRTVQKGETVDYLICFQCSQ